jgi:uncharacterized protein (DUF2141 family)
MKQFLLHSILRSRLPLAALALGFALWASPARAITIYGGPLTLGAGDTEYISFSCDTDEVANADNTAKRRSVRMDDDPKGHVSLFKVLSDGTLSQVKMIEMYETVGNTSLPVFEGQFAIRGVSPGETTVTLSIAGNEASIDVTVTEPTSITFVDGSGTPANVFYVPESDQETGRLTLDFGYNLPGNVSFTVMSSDADNIAFASPFVAYQGAATAQFTFTPKNGPASARLTFTGDSAYQDGAGVTINITNVPPRLVSPTGTEENPTLLDALQGSTKTFIARASDVQADTLKFHWCVNGAEVMISDGVRQAGGFVVSSADLTIDTDETLVSVFVEDGSDVSREGFWKVTLTESADILFTDECTVQQVTVRGGNGPATFHRAGKTDDQFDDVPAPHSYNGNKFKTPGTIRVSAQPAEGTYPFGWSFSDPAYAIDPADLYIPNHSTAPINIKVPAAGEGATIRYFSSRPYFPYADIDNFGDFDQDGLSDDWEAYYLDGGKDGATHVFSEWANLAVTTSRGEYGPSGTHWDGDGSWNNLYDTPDNDRIPTRLYEEIENVWTADPHYVDGMVNLVRVFKYPLTGSYIDYGTHIVGEGGGSIYTISGLTSYEAIPKQTTGTKPFFSNIMEFRGLPQSASEDKNNPNWVYYGYPGILGTYASLTNGAVRGNCPGTDPTVADTDGDIFEDGWEYYFWSTILYENKPEYWRAFDPTFTLYPNLAPGGGADFKATGLPLLRRALADYEAEYDGGLFVRYPAQEFEPELIRDECYYGSPNLDPSTRTNNKNSLTNTPIGSVAYYETPGDDEPTPAVVFMMGGLEVYTRDGHVDALGRAKLFYNPRQTPDYYTMAGPQPSYNGQEGVYPTAMGASLEPGEISGAYVDFLSGQFFLPGYDYFPADIQEIIGSRDATLVVRYRTVNGLFPKSWLLSQFDPMDPLVGLWGDKWEGYPDFAAILGSLGIDPGQWDCTSDLDGDGLSNYEEYFLGTNPMHWDTDNDGLPDGWEVLFELDPHNPSDASENPDCDVMYTSGGYRHCDAFLYDYFNDVFWNGQASLGFLPGAGAHSSPAGNFNIPFTSREEFYVQKWMIGKDDSGNYPMFVNAVYPSMWWDYNRMQPIKSLNPRSDDSNEDHIPDGWALYAGYKPAGSIDLIDHVWAPFYALPMACPAPLRPDPDDKQGDGLVWLDEFENWTMYNTRQAQIDNGVYVAENQMDGHYHPASWYEPRAKDWTNKLYPTDPWHGDTDGDGLPDIGEYQESGGDNNGDGLTLLNFNPCSADTRLDRLGDPWHYATGLYDTTNAARAGLQGEFGPYGDPDRDGLPNYQEYLTTAVYGWRYDYWYSPDNEELWVPFGEFQAPYSMKDEDLEPQIAADPYIRANYSMDPIAGTGERLYEVAAPLFGFVPLYEDAYPYGKSVHFQPYRPSDFFRGRPSSKRINDIISTVIRLERRWTREITHTPKVLLLDDEGNPILDDKGNPQIVDGEPHTAQGWDETYSPTLNDLAKAEEDPQLKVSVIANYIQRVYALTHDRDCRFMLEEDPITGELKPTAFISLEEFYTLYNGWPSAECDLRDYMYSYGSYPAPWEPQEVQVVDPGVPVLWSFAPTGAPFPSCLPRDPDSDHDGMDDYWEVYHGLNPLYGGSPDIGGAGSYPDQDRADKHEHGLGSVRDWYMQPNPAYVRVLSGGLAISREPRAFAYLKMGPPLMEAAHFDYMTRPWLAGDRFADPDQDGLCNQEESYNYLLNDVLHHTDPSPHWFTDPSYAESYVNLYYKVDGELGSTYWWWDKDLLGSDADGPTYLFDFEINEGFDTDNDNIADSIELTQDDNNGVTDPLDLDSPRKRKALYFDGNAAARTRNPYYHDKFTLTSYTVEFWVRPQQLPAAGRRMTLVQRPVLMPVDDSSGATHWDIRNTFLVQLDDLGRVIARVDNDARETVASATAVSAGRLVPNKWAHVAVVMDSVRDRLELYINGEYAAGIGAGLKPCTGGLFGFQYQSPVGLEGRWESANLYDYSPAPIVLGAYDRNPWGIVGGVYETYPWGTLNAGRSSIAGQSEPDFDPEQYFVGWMDEVRVWDRCRSQTEIKNNMMKRFTKADIEAVNRKRLAWELEDWDQQDPQIDRIGTNLVAATQMSEWPQKLLYHYAFDNLPDVMAARDRDTSYMQYFTADADPFPAGWQSDTVSAYRPNPFWTAPMWYHYRSLVFPHIVPWWYAAEHRSNIYTDYSYIPWIENTVAHMPQTPALDMKGLFPNWDPSSWTVTSYRYRAAMDWMSDALGPTDFVPNRQDDAVPAALPATGSTDVTLERIRNSMNPYVMFYRTAISFVDERRPNAFAGKLDRYGRYTGIPVLSDMLPLMDAVADIDVPMWDGKGRGTELDAVDTDGDGLPDWWEIAHGLDPNAGTGLNGAYGDADGDGLDNWAEYLAHTDPFRYDTDGDGYSDYYSRPNGQSLTYGELYDDGDGMDNVWEQLYGLDPNRYDATDDYDNDGWTNWEEFMAGTNPTRADKFPEPNLDVTFHYTGNNGYGVYGTPAPALVKAYAEKTAGRKMGGQYDGTYYSRQTELGQFEYSPIVVEIGGTPLSFDWVADMNNQDISSDAIVTIRVENETVRCQVAPSAADSQFGIVYQNEGTHDLVVMDYTMGVMYGQTGYYINDGETAIYHYTFNGGSYEAEYAVSPKSFPFSLRGMTRIPEGNGHDHMVSGWNRFLGWLDLDGNETWTPGEPMGLSTPRPAMVSWDSVETTVPLSDSVWDYPRLAWDAPTNVPGIGEMTYFVDFTWVRGATTDTETETIGGGNSNYAKTGDWDGDGLEDWMELLAGTPTNSVAGDPNDYYSIDPVSGFAYGELYDDGDGMPTSWELKYGLDPYRNDAKGDVDDDGWSNYAEFMAGTRPTDAGSYPKPKFAATFLYHGQETDLQALGIYTYGQKTQGATWGGAFDGRYLSSKQFTYGVVLGSDGTVTYENSDNGFSGTYNYTDLSYGLVESASIDVYVTGADGATEVRQFQMSAAGDAGAAAFTQDDTGWICMERESGRVLVTGGYVGQRATVSIVVRSFAFPVTFTDLIRVPDGNRTHMVEGPNRFFGWMDIDGNQTYDQGEPAGLGLYAPTLVGWDSTSVEIPLVDERWDYPRVSWNDFVPTNFVPTDYVVRFMMLGKTTSGTITTNTEEKTTTVGIYGDLDGDGLDAWAEAKTGTDLNKADTDGDGRIDFDQVDTGKVLDSDGKLTFGEILDDSDGMPAQWEISFGLDPHLFDADADLDDDGWSNYAEFMANTDPVDPDDYPEPQFDVTFRYDGEANGASTLKVVSYSEKRQGTHLVESNPRTIYMGGIYDGLYTTQAKGFGNFADLGRGEIDGKDFGTSSFGGERIGSASLTVNYVAEEGGTATKTTYQLQPYNDSFGVFVDDGEAFILLEYSTGLIYSQFNYQVSRGRSEINADGTTTTISEQVQETSYDTSPHYQSRYTIEYSSSTTHYPFTIRGLQAANAAEDTGAYTAHDHMVEGYNRFLSWMDLNNDNTWTPGEPMGLSLYDATLVGWDSAVTEIPLTDELFGFPRLAWEAPTNMANVTGYRIYIRTFDGYDVVPSDGLLVEAPRTFLHEGDYVEAGIRGLNLRTSGNNLYNFNVIADDGTGETVVTNGEFRLNAQEVEDGARRAMAPIYPVNNAVLREPIVELRWNMDWRTEGVFITIKKDGSAVAGLDGLYVPFPVRHNKLTDDDYYYSYIPQLKDGRSLVSLGAGSYTWEVKENLRLTGYTAKTATGSFKISTGLDTTRSVASISGNVHYYGRLASAAGVFDAGKVVILAYRVSDRATSSLNVSGVPVAKITRNGAGAFTVPNLEPGAYGLVGFVDANGNGLPDVGETQGMAFMGGSADPIQLPEWFKPIRIAVKDGAAVPVEDVHIVLRDRDTNGDGVPEIFSGTLAQYKAKNVVTVPATKPTTGPGTNWVSTAVFDPNFKPYSSRTTKTTTTSGGGSETTGGAEWQFAVRAPRTFLHEGDLARLATYGFDLGQANAADFTWEVIATDGYHTETNSGGAFSVFAGTPDTRTGIKARWPTQRTVVHGSTVKFEWEMDHRNAGVSFKIENAATGEVVFDGVVAFPVLHWDPTVQCYYYTAVPQMEDGLRFVDLPDGTYRYTVTERPNSGAITPQTFTETFQIRNAENTRMTGSIEGDVWYFGRSTVPGTSDPSEWADDLHVQAYLVSDAATSSASVGGLLVADEVQNANGAFRIEGLKAGTYSVFAFVDSNGNGIADDWETQGFGFYGGNASPVVIPSAAIPIVVTNGASVVGVNVVLHDRDTDGDLLPDAWEYDTYGSLTAQTGYDAAASNAYTSLSAPDADYLTNWIWKIDTSTVVTKVVDIPETDTLRVRVDGPRTFLHEGDFLTPWVYVNKKKGLVAEGVPEKTSNREYYMWGADNDEDGRPDPLDSPYYGFQLGSYSNVVVNWTVSVWDGAASMSLTGGAFRVVARVGSARKPLLARYPNQKTPIHGNVVEFEWEMDDSNAGVVFNLWKESDVVVDENGMTIGFEPNEVQVITNMVIAFPIRHGRSGTDGSYWSAIPQIEDGSHEDGLPGRNYDPDIGKVFIELPGDGLYRYTIKERPRTSILAPEDVKTVAQTVTEWFQLVNSGEMRGLYDASGTIRYYGRLLEDEPLDALAEPFAVDPGNDTVWRAVIATEEIARGSMSVRVKDENGDSIEVFNDSAANGILYVSGGTNTTAWSGTIDYETGEIEVRFTRPLPAGRTPELARKKFPVPLVLQAYRLANEAQTCVSVSGTPVYKEIRYTKGDFLVPNLEGGKYAFLAFLDSNGNGFADEWETQGVAVMTGTVSPNIDANSAPIVVEDNVTGLMIVLHDRDTDNDLLPDSWEWWRNGNLLTSGYDPSDAGGLLWWQEYADGVLDSDPRTPDTDLDGLTDAMEILVTKTDTHLKDTDGDGIGDLEEFLSGSDPLDAASAVPYAVPALAFDEAGAPFVDIAYPAIRPGVVLTFELQRKLSLADEAWETVAEHEVANTGGEVLYSQYDGVNSHMTEPGTARMLPADQAEGVDFTTGFYRVKVYADYGRMVDNGDGTWSYWTWVKSGASAYTFKETARGKGTLVRDADGNWHFVSDATGMKGVLVRDEDGNWSFQD